jgi:iron only hydrogenase large subunit-like protein
MSIRAALTRLDNMNIGDIIDVSLTNGVAISRKEMRKDDHDDFVIFHSICDAWVTFTRQMAAEVLEGTRSPWDGVVDGEDEEEIDEGP